jgi:hypothetical protein
MHETPVSCKPFANVTHISFLSSVNEFRIYSDNPFALLLTPPVKHTRKNLYFLSPDEKAGYALIEGEDGHTMLSSVFRYKDAEYSFDDIMDSAIFHSPDYLVLDCYGTFLRNKYAERGFSVLFEDTFNKKLAPRGWNPNVHGYPLYYFMERRGV